ncbi:hypothetical protein TNCV_208611 [Trichonephila clavipes]|uniref:Uncharacterized protein n=1 Tax=Trichonephila clavipes TaxID=2585209 RepID=A0A8X6VS56_TRICX|nr:hypothetical protein TNCV_208611 [Trichonephila clavipes]
MSSSLVPLKIRRVEGNLRETCRGSKVLPLCCGKLLGASDIFSAQQKPCLLAFTSRFRLLGSLLTRRFVPPDHYSPCSDATTITREHRA